MRRQITAVLMVLCLSASFIGCGGNPSPDVPRSQTATVAKYGGDLMASVRTVQQTVAAMKLPENVTAAMMATFEKIGQKGLQLSKTLQAYELATNVLAKQTLGKDIGEQLQTITTLVNELLLPVTTIEARTEVSKLLTNIYNLILTIRGAVPTLATPSAFNSIGLEVVSWT